jgi:hypothetical protein
MRHILVDMAHASARGRRGDGAEPVTLEESFLLSPGRAADVVALDDALTALAKPGPLPVLSNRGVTYRP